MYVKRTYTNKWRMGFWFCVGCGMYNIYDPLFGRYVEAQFWDMSFKWWRPEYDDWKRRERYRWTRYLENWSPKSRSQGRSNMGRESNSITERWVYGKNKYQEPVSYEESAEKFMNAAETCGIDPGQPMFDSIKKVVDYYYPDDLDENPDETKQVLKPKIQWVYGGGFDQYIEDEEAMPKPNTIARYLWYVPGYQDYLDKIKMDARNEEERIVTSLNKNDRTGFYEKMDRLSSRWSIELNDYAPLLANRWDMKHKLARYLMNKNNKIEIQKLLSKPGGVKQIFINAGVITKQKTVNINDIQTQY